MQRCLSFWVSNKRLLKTPQNKLNEWMKLQNAYFVYACHVGKMWIRKKNESTHKENVGKPNAFMYSSTIHTPLTKSVISLSMFNVWQKTKLTLCLCCEMKLKHCCFFLFATCRNLKCLQAYADFSSFTISIFCYNVFCDIV